MSHGVARIVLIVSTLATCWLGMQIVHEAGHVLAAWLTGGTITNVVLHPLTISRTDVFPNPHPTIVVWSGPLVGCVIPLMAAFVAQWLRVPAAFLFRFFAGFCCVANGAYIGAGALFPVGDAHVMRGLGTAAWTLALFGAVATSLGLLMWNGLAAHFGVGPAGRPVSRHIALSMLAVCSAIVVLEVLFA